MIYVTSDLHGCPPKDFFALLSRAGFADSDFLFVLGDVIDRGESGAELLLWMTGQPNVQLILGNHEAMLLSCKFLFDPVSDESLARLTPENMELMNTWLHNGGGPTLEGFRRLLKKDPELVEGILEYLEDAPLFESLTVNGGRYILTHSGIGGYRPGKSLGDYPADAFLFARPELSDEYDPGATVIFGHTPTVYMSPEYKGRAIRTPTWINIDTGAAMGLSPMLLRLEDGKEFY